MYRRKHFVLFRLRLGIDFLTPYLGLLWKARLLFTKTLGKHSMYAVCGQVKAVHVEGAHFKLAF